MLVLVKAWMLSLLLVLLGLSNRDWPLGTSELLQHCMHLHTCCMSSAWRELTFGPGVSDFMWDALIHTWAFWAPLFTLSHQAVGKCIYSAHYSVRSGAWCPALSLNIPFLEQVLDLQWKSHLCCMNAVLWAPNRSQLWALLSTSAGNTNLPVWLMRMCNLDSTTCRVQHMDRSSAHLSAFISVVLLLHFPAHTFFSFPTSVFYPPFHSF